MTRIYNYVVAVTNYTPKMQERIKHCNSLIQWR